MILQLCIQGRSAIELLGHGAVQTAADAYSADLERKKLVPDAAQKSARKHAVMIAALILFGVAAFKILFAMSRGRSNVLFLIVLAGFALLFLLPVLRNRMTALGKDTLDRLKTLFARLNRNATRLRSGGRTNEALLLGAVFGLYALPSLAFPYVEHLYPRKTGRNGDSGCGTGSSDSSGCGGGGGCGGCGGGD